MPRVYPTITIRKDVGGILVEERVIVPVNQVGRLEFWEPHNAVRLKTTVLIRKEGSK